MTPSASEVRLYDTFKAVALVALVLLFVVLLMVRWRASAAVPEDALGPMPTVLPTLSWTTSPTTANPTPETTFAGASGTPSLTAPTESPSLPPGATPTPASTAPVIASAVSRNPGSITLGGTGTPGERVEVLADDQVVGLASVDDAGKWEITFEAAEGSHALVARSASDSAAASPPVFLVVTTGVNPKPVPGQACQGEPGVNLGDRYIVGICDTLSRIAVLTRVQLDDLISANPQIEDPDLIYTGQVTVIP